MCGRVRPARGIITSNSEQVLNSEIHPGDDDDIHDPQFLLYLSDVAN